MDHDPKEKMKVVDVVKITDGLGNQMFQYAFARKLQIRYGKKVFLDTRSINHEDKYLRGEKDSFHKRCDHRQYGLDHFRITIPKADEKILGKWKFLDQNNRVEQILYKLCENDLWIRKYKNEDHLKNMRDVFKRSSFCSTYFQGYFFDLYYYNDIRTVLQKEFSLKKPMRLPVGLKKILKSRNTVSVHIRRGDFVRLFRDISLKDYYPKAIDLMIDRIEEPIFLVFSDDIRWVKENIDIDRPKIYISEMGFKDHEELAIMKHCKYNIIANSTFSYWAAFLNDHPEKIVVCPKRWKTGIIPNGWITI